jgi:DNA-binding LacI/PurR family transcriptional regulator/DNA-binding transcriptional regulator YhcF (GntR family)
LNLLFLNLIKIPIPENYRILLIATSINNYFSLSNLSNCIFHFKEVFTIKETQYPALSQAVNFFRELVSSTPRGTRLSSIRSIAAKAGVSNMTMWKAVEILRTQGAVRVVKGQGITTAGPPPVSNTPQTPDQKWQALRDMIRSDIFTGRFDPHRPLPQLKQLQKQYGVSYFTLKRALVSLHREGTLESCKNSYRMANTAPLTSGVSSWRIFFILQGTDKERLILHDAKAANLLRGLERECSIAGLKLVITGYEDHKSEPYFITTSGISKVIDLGKSTLGFILFLDNIADSERLIRYISSFGKPMSILSNSNQFVLPQMKYSSPVRLFLEGDTKACGYDVGRYLIQLGHRSVAFISSFYTSAWVLNRLSGVRSAFDQAGIENGVIAYIDDEHESDDFLENAHIEIGQIPQIFTLETNQLLKDNSLLIRTLEIMKYFTPLFEKALENPDITAWICANDVIALLALRFLSDRKIAVPRRLSVIGFDDIQTALEYGLSTYRFDMETLGHNMLMHVSHPDWRPFSNVKRTVEINGRIIERETTAAIKN